MLLSVVLLIHTILKTSLGSFELSESSKEFILYTVSFISIVVYPLGLLVFNDAYFRILVVFLVANNIGNALSFLYPPYHIIDMLGYLPNRTIYNCADLYGKISQILMKCSPIYVLSLYLFRRIKNLNNR